MPSPPTGKDKGKTRTSSAAEGATPGDSEKQADAGPSTDPSAAAPPSLHRHHSESDPSTQPLPETSSSDLGLLRLSEQISRNEERLKDVPLLGSTIADSQTLEAIPSIGASPGMAMAPPGQSQEYVQSSPPFRSSNRQSVSDLHPIPEGDSQLGHLSIDDLSATQMTQDAPLDTSVSHESSHDTADVGNISAVSSAPNTSVEYNANNSIQSQASNHSSGSSHGNRSHDSQGSRVSQGSSGSQSHSSGSNTSSLSFRGATTSTPQQTPQPRTYASSQSTTPSDNERIDRRASLESSHSQISPPTGGSAPTSVWHSSLSPDPQPFKTSSFPGAQGKKGRTVPGDIHTGVVHTVERGTGHRLATLTTTTTASSGITATAGPSNVIMGAPKRPVDDFESITDLPDDLKEEDDEDDEAARRRLLLAKGKGVAPLPPAAGSGSKEQGLVTIAEENDEVVDPGPAEHELGLRRSMDDPLVAAGGGGAGPSSQSSSPRRRPPHRRSDSGSSGSNSNKSRRVRRAPGATSAEYLSSDDDDEPGGPSSQPDIHLHLTESFRGESFRGLDMNTSDITSATTSVLRGGRSRTASLPSSEGLLSRAGSGLMLLPEASHLVEGEAGDGDRAQVLEGHERESGPYPLGPEGSIGDVYSSLELASAREPPGGGSSSSFGGAHGPSGPTSSLPRASLHRTRSGLSHSSWSGRSSLSLEGAGELPSSQASSSSGGQDPSFIHRLVNAEEDNEDEDRAVHKRRRKIRLDSSDYLVVSSIGDEDGWDGSDRSGDRRGASSRGSGSGGGSSGGASHSITGGVEPESLPLFRRSPSQDISSYPEGSYSEDSLQSVPEATIPTSSTILDAVPAAPAPAPVAAPKAAKEVVESIEPVEPKTPTRRSTRSSARLQAQAESGGGGSSVSSSQKSGIGSRSPRKPSTPSKQQQQQQQGSGSQRTRVSKAGDVLRHYKAKDPVWAKWKRRYYTGFVSSTVKDGDKYDVQFTDNYRKLVPRTSIRPLKMMAGIEVMARRQVDNEAPAIVEGFAITKDLDSSNVDVRFDDGVEENMELWKINMTEAMFASLERKIDWDGDYPMVVKKQAPPPPQTATAAEAATTTVAGATVTSPPPKARGNYYPPPYGPSSSSLEAHSLEQPGTPSRARTRAAVTHSDPVAPMTPSRRNKVNTYQFFRNYKFVVTMSGEGDDALQKRLIDQIKKFGGTVLEDFESVVSNQRDVQENVFLITRRVRRTKKFIEALALNVPRVSYRWVEICIKEHLVIPFQQFLLPTGHSYEAEAVVCSVPETDRGVFHDLKVGVCSSNSFWKRWRPTLHYGGANVVRIQATEGPQDCNYIVFGGKVPYERYIGAHPQVESLSNEWIIQCMINQKVVAIDSHPSLTRFDANPLQDPQ
ncbi:hypothetical protein DFQ26_000304 [Actinomortierella ambigua]|nr:hypothetical protein DFQ26_000304 [Actinomortierella ambigua]